MSTICHFEIGVRDQKKAGDFYSKLFEWKLEPGPHGAMLRTGEPVGGHLHTSGNAPHNYTIFYIMVDDVAATLAKAEAAGGKKLVGPVEMDGGKSEYGRIADPEGNVIGIYAEKK
jgi:predicted enzyme related to lactoylglutathione lyase